jgi:hypothetical protein
MASSTYYLTSLSISYIAVSEYITLASMEYIPIAIHHAKFDENSFSLCSFLYYGFEV